MACANNMYRDINCGYEISTPGGALDKVIEYTALC